MCPDSIPKTGTRSRTRMAQRGFSIVSAIFLLVIMAALGAFMLTFSNVQQTTSAQDLQGSRAYQAARTGIEWGLYKVLTPASPPGVATCTTASLGPLAGTLAVFTVNVLCTVSTYTEGSTTVSIYQITSTATSGAQSIERQLQVTAGR